MQIIGSIGEDTLWELNFSGLKSRWGLYSRESFNTNNTTPLQPHMLQTKQIRLYNEYLIASACCIGKGEVKFSYGELPVIYSLIKKLTELYLVDDALEDNIREGQVTEDISVISINYAISNTNRITGVTYEQVTAQHKSSQSLNAFRKSISRRRMRSYEEIIKEYDTSWMYDDKGRKIKDYRLITNVMELDNLKRELEEANPEIIAFDTETTGTDFYYFPGHEELRSRICGCSLSWKLNQGIYIVFESTHIGTLPIDMVFSWLVPFINKRKCVAHNGLFDRRVLYSYGYNLIITDDTMVLEFNLDSRVSRGSKGLKELTRKYYGHNTLELEDILGANPNYELVPEIDPRLIELYACADTDYCLRLYVDLIAEVQRLGRKCYNIDRPMFRYLPIADFYGSHIDMDLLLELSEINKKDLAALEAVMWEFIKDIGAKTQAARFIRSVTSPNYEPTAAEVQEVLRDDRFKDIFNSLLHKQTKKGEKSYREGGDGWELQFSSSRDIAHIMYTILDYPVISIDLESKAWSTDEEALTNLMNEAAEVPLEFLSHDIISAVTETNIKVSDKDKVVLSVEKFKSYKYPFAYLLSRWRALEKQRTSFFNPLLENNTGGWYYTRNSMTSAETARVINPIQTLAGSLKKLVIPYSDDYYQVVFDMAQIEFRVMLGLANSYWSATGKRLCGSKADAFADKNLHELIERLNDPEKDYHREGGSIFAGCTPEDMTKEQRSKIKAVHFSVPFGAGAASIAKDQVRKARTEAEREAVILDMETTLANWNKNLYPLAHYLAYIRKQAFIPVPDEKLPSALQGGKWGMVSNPVGRVRYFDLTDCSSKNAASIRRQVGNFPIQSLAREIFFRAITNLAAKLRKDGLITEHIGTEKIIIHNPVHDEATLQVHKSIHPYKLYQYILDSIIMELPGFPRFYMGLSIVNNWYDGKDDKFEAPVDFVRQQAKAYAENPEKYDAENLWECNVQERVLKDMEKYMAKRYYDYVVDLQKDCDDPYLIDPAQLCPRFKNYFLKSRVALYTDIIRDKKYYDKSISKEDAAVLLRLDGYIKAAAPGEFEKYRTLIDGKEYYLKDIQAPPPEELSETDALLNEVGNLGLDLDLDIDLDLSEALSDYEDEEDRRLEEYYTLTSDSRTILVSPINKEAVREEEDGIFSIEPQEADVIFEDFNGRLVCNVTGLTPKGIRELVDAIKMYKSPRGKPLMFLDTRVNVMTDSKQRLLPGYDKELLKKIVRENQKVVATSTNVFR